MPLDNHPFRAGWHLKWNLQNSWEKHAVESRFACLRQATLGWGRGGRFWFMHDIHAS